MDLRPLRRRDFRLLYIGQFVSFFGSVMSYIALPYVLYQSTKSTILTGLLGVIQLIPSVVGGLFGGALADSLDRKRLIIVCEVAMASVILAIGIAVASFKPGYPSAVWFLLAAAALSVLNGFHRPALEAMTPRLVAKDELPAVGVLSTFRGNVGMIGGPALAGVVIASIGPEYAFFINVGTFAFSLVMILMIRHVPKVERAAEFSFRSVREGFRYAMSRQELVGTYAIDIIAMTFSMPNLLFPAVADAFGSAVYLGWLHSGISIGALVATFTMGRLLKNPRHGLIIVIAAALWSVSMIGFGLAWSFPIAMAFLILAGYADMVSAVFRMTIWNQTIPDEYRGRLAGIEMISYTGGPMLGNTQLGFLSSAIGIQRAIAISSFIGVGGIIACAKALPRFVQYRAPETVPEKVQENPLGATL